MDYLSDGGKIAACMELLNTKIATNSINLINFN